VDDADFIIPIVIDNQIHNVYVLKRPGVDEFMKKMSELYEIVVFTASLATVSSLFSSQCVPFSILATTDLSSSMLIRCWIISIFITWWTIDCSENHVVIIWAIL
jgi:hypothetical protein